MELEIRHIKIHRTIVREQIEYFRLRRNSLLESESILIIDSSKEATSNNSEKAVLCVFAEITVISSMAAMNCWPFESDGTVSSMRRFLRFRILQLPQCAYASILESSTDCLWCEFLIRFTVVYSF